MIAPSSKGGGGDTLDNEHFLFVYSEQTNKKKFTDFFQKFVADISLVLKKMDENHIILYEPPAFLGNLKCA